MYLRKALYQHPGWRFAALAVVLAVAAPARAEVDRTRYMTTDELRPGMTGFGRTVMSGTRIETFEFEVIGVMRNAWYARQDVILIRASGLNLEHSGIVGGMSGSPCYVRDEDGNERMIGAVAYGWLFNKDPICGVQPISQMLEIVDVRDPQRDGRTEGREDASSSSPRRGPGSLALGEVIARGMDEPVDDSSRFSVFNDAIESAVAARRTPEPSPDRLRPLLTPVMVSGLSEESMGFLKRRFARLGLEPVASGGAAPEVAAEAGDLSLEPGSVLCVPLMTGDIQIDALGTCTEVVDGRVLGFGHSFFADGHVRLPMATGMVHTVIASVMRSNKLGAALTTVGTFWGDEEAGIFGTIGESPRMIPFDVTVTDVRGERAYHYEMVQERMLTPILLGIGTLESIFAHSTLPEEHTLHYTLETTFKELGTFRTRNTVSQQSTRPVFMDIMTPATAMMNSPFGRAEIEKARLEVTIESRARMASIEHASLPKTLYRPGETIPVRVRWQHFRQDPAFTEDIYEIDIPEDMPDGSYVLTLGAAAHHLQALRTERPHEFQVRSHTDVLAAMNRVAGYPQDRLYMRLQLPTGGLAVDRVEMPALPSFQRRILTQAKPGDTTPYRDALVVDHETGFVVVGQQSFTIQVKRRAES